MSVHDELFLPGDEDPILHQGGVGAAPDHQVFGGNSLVGSQQGSLVESGRDLAGGNLPPPNQGHVPSHVSVASATTFGYFGAT